MKEKIKIIDNRLSYKGYETFVHFNMKDNIFHGKIEDIDDLITFEGKTAKETLTAFRQAVEGYIDTLERINDGKI